MCKFYEYQTILLLMNIRCPACRYCVYFVLWKKSEAYQNIANLIPLKCWTAAEESLHFNSQEFRES